MNKLDFVATSNDIKIYRRSSENNYEIRRDYCGNDKIMQDKGSKYVEDYVEKCN
jgi:hypothetical protein